jgi:hypothetical protein
MSEPVTFSETDVLNQMRKINSIDLINASPKERDKIKNDMQKLYTKYKDNRKNDTFTVSIIQAIKGFEDKNPGLKVIDNYDDYQQIFGPRTVDATNPQAYGPTYKRWGGKKRTCKYKKSKKCNWSKKRKTKKHKQKIRR